MLDVRKDFPILVPGADGRRLSYLDSAASSQKPVQVLEAVRDYYETSNANVHRGAYDLAVRATELFESARDTVAGFVGAYDRSGVVFVRGTTEASNLVANAWGHSNVREGDTIVVTALEHHSNLVPWQILCQRVGAQLRMVELDAAGRLDMADLRSAVGLRPKLVAVGHVSNALGTINPVGEIVQLAHAVGARVFVDGAQAVPHLAVNVADLDADFYAFSGHKMLAPMGIGALVAKPELLEEMTPYQGGGEMILSVEDDHSTYAPPPAKFEGGTPNVGGVVGLAAAIEYLDAIGMKRVREHEVQLVEYALARLDDVVGATVYGPRQPRSGVVSFSFGGIHPHDLATILDREGVAIRAGHHCAQPLMRRLGVAATARASFYVYNDTEDVDRLVHALGVAAEIFGATV